MLIALDELLSATQDAETGQRGFLLTGNSRYLEPYNSAAETTAEGMRKLSALTRDNPVQQDNLNALKRHIDAKVGELRETIDLRRDQGIEAALAVVTTDRGKMEMDAIRAQLGTMRQRDL